MDNWFISNIGSIGFVFFFSMFMLILFLVLRPSARDKIESYKYIPFCEDLDGHKKK